MMSDLYRMAATTKSLRICINPLKDGSLCVRYAGHSLAAEGILEGFDREQFPKEAIEEKIILR